MFKGQKGRLIFKNLYNWHLGPKNNIYLCSKCNKYNTIIEDNNKLKFQLCLFCGNPNYINK